MTSRYFDQLDVNADGNDVIISVAANAIQLLNLAQAAQVQASATSASAAGSGSWEVSANVNVPE